MCYAPLRLLVSIQFQVLFHSHTLGTFHLSLTVLVHYRSDLVFSLRARSPDLPTGLHVSSCTQGQYPRRKCVFNYGTITLYGGLFQAPSSNTFNFLDLAVWYCPITLAYLIPDASKNIFKCVPPKTNTKAKSTKFYEPPVFYLRPKWDIRVWAVPFSLAATGGIATAFFSSGYLDVSVPRVPSYPWFQTQKLKTKKLKIFSCFATLYFMFLVLGLLILKPG